MSQNPGSGSGSKFNVFGSTTLFKSKFLCCTNAGKMEFDVEDYSFSQTTLEQVFIEFAKQQEMEEVNLPPPRYQQRCKLPEFWPANPVLWFARAEFNFEVAQMHSWAALLLKVTSVKR